MRYDIFRKTLTLAATVGLAVSAFAPVSKSAPAAGTKTLASGGRIETALRQTPDSDKAARVVGHWDDAEHQNDPDTSPTVKTVALRFTVPKEFNMIHYEWIIDGESQGIKPYHRRMGERPDETTLNMKSHDIQLKWHGDGIHQKGGKPSKYQDVTVSFTIDRSKMKPAEDKGTNVLLELKATASAKLNLAVFYGKKKISATWT